MVDKKKYISDNLINLKGKSYLQVAHRVVAFRAEHPDWGIITETKDIGETTYVYASVFNESGNPMATAHKQVAPKGTGKGAAAMWPLETAETGAIGRALGLCGFGTLGGDLDEGEQLADAPTQKEWKR